MQQLIWGALSQQQQQSCLQRPALSAARQIPQTVAEIIRRVRQEGDAALLEYAKQFDQVELAKLALSEAEKQSAIAGLSASFKQALSDAYHNITLFHSAQDFQPIAIATQPGVNCEMVSRPIEAVGLYIPGGSAPLPSTVLMLGVPARIAGCKRKVLVSPPPIAAEIIYAAELCGIEEIYQVGGAQAVAALAYGTESIAAVDKIFGPGNAYVTEAKLQVSQQPEGAAIDMPAGPSEVLVIADAEANPEFIAADLLSQAEHGPDSQVVLVTPEPALVAGVEAALQRQLAQLSRSEIATTALDNSLSIICRDLDEAVAISNQYAPEHLIIQTREPQTLLPAIQHAGSVFLGDWTPESVGDYASGTNHVLPTYGQARTCSSLSLADFCKRFTVQQLTPAGLKGLADTVTTIADAEGLDAHSYAVRVRVAAMEEKG